MLSQGDARRIGLGHDDSRAEPIVRNGPPFSAYFETDFLNMRSIFSLMASMAVELACALASA
jgi:hypothetical protein